MIAGPTITISNRKNFALTRRWWWWSIGLCWSATVVASSASLLRINEFVASNENGLADYEGGRSDWLELYNGGGTAIDLTDYSLTDDLAAPAKWKFPPGTSIPPQAYLIVFCSNKGQTGTLTGGESHTNFKLSAEGEYMGLYDNAEVVVSEFRPTFPGQTDDVSYGYDAAGVMLGFFPVPTPGAENGAMIEDPVDATVQFSVERGFYDAPFSLVLSTTSTTTPPTIRYTLDGSTPTATTGLVYAEPISIVTTTTVRAMVFDNDDDNVATHTYIFLADVIRQPKVIPQFPNNGKIVDTRIKPTESVPLDFEMSPAVCQSSTYGGEIMQAMRQAIPTLVLTSSIDDLYGDDGYYYGEDAAGEPIEKKVSLEVFYPASTTSPQQQQQQLYVGARAHSRQLQKRSLRLNFRSDYGTSTWETDLLQDYFPLQGDGATNRLRRVVLRAGGNRSWARSFAPHITEYTLDQFVRSTQIEMSSYGSRGTFVHLYLNGVYEGMYNLVERPDDSLGEAYFGGNDDIWFYTNHDEVGSKDDTRWRYLTEQLAWRDMTVSANYAELQEYLDVEAFVDYMILMFYVGMTDWPYNNWFVISRNAGDSLGATPAKFVVWDAELSMDFRKSNGRQGSTIQSRFLYKTGYHYDAILNLWHAAKANPAFMQLFYDRVEFHTRPGGALSVEAVLSRWQTITAFVDSAVIGESCRWGDALKTHKWQKTRTRNDTFRPQVERIRKLLTTNTDQFLDEVKWLRSCDPTLGGVGPICTIKGFIYWLLEKLGLLGWSP